MFCILVKFNRSAIMIVPAMTIQEIHKELLEDVKSLNNKMEYCKEDFAKCVLRTRCYPFAKSYDCVTKERKNFFNVTFTALKRSSRKNPMFAIYGLYVRREGTYAVALTLEMNMISIYPPHFFQRYRERIVKDDSISNRDIIKRYFRNDWGFTASVVNENFEAVYRCFEIEDKNDRVSFVAVTTQGYCFGERQGDVNIMKTIISEDMLHENQKPLFNKLREDLIKANKEWYNMNIDVTKYHTAP